ncbi:MAG: FAD-binding oxidoreductase [Leptolyngbya sp. DLM2.Bin15]|nr:MAG: FAD-binding oxidoreductase [Leptolyngbya sp. DLM2.Bin15]
MVNSASEGSTVLVVGSGITGLMTAYYARQAGYLVRLVSKSPDPRQAKADIQFEASTWDGYVNRYITLTEGHPYLDLPGYITTMYPDIDSDFRQDISQGGMLVHPLSQWGKLTQQFLHERDIANRDQQATLALFHEYLDENRASLEYWYKLLIEIVRLHPQIINKLSLHTHGIDRFYDEEVLFAGANAAQSSENIVKQSYSPEQLLQNSDFRVYESGISKHKFISGGGLTIYGLAFDIQALCQEWLLGELESQGVELLFGDGYNVVSIERDTQGYILGLKTQNGELHLAKHIFLHPGAYMDPQVLAGTPAYGKLAGVKGLWMRIKNAQNLFDHAPRPNKIHGGKYDIQVGNRTFKGQVCDLNIMPKHNSDGSWELVIGSGYLFVGTYPFEGDSSMGSPLASPVAEADRQTQIQFMEELAIRAFAQVVSRIYDLDIDVDSVMAGTHHYIDLPSKGCIRSWTPNDRELSVLLPTALGGVTIIDGGGNTGSTTKAPFISKTAIKFTQILDQAEVKPVRLDAEELQTTYHQVRASLRRTKDNLPASQWQRLENELNEAIAAAQLHG